jgi:hypothetical protein
MDPLTLLALANGAVAAIKKGCQLYKDIKSAAGDVKGVLDDLDKQFNKQHETKPATKEQRQQFEQKKKEVRADIEKDPNDVMSIIGDQLGTFFDAMDKIEELFYEEEKKSKEVYTGDVSLSRRALQRVLIRSRLEQMEVELREQMIYNVPADLKDLWTRFQEMRVQIIQEQKVARAIKEKEDAIKAAIKKQRMSKYQFEFALGIGSVFLILVIGIMFMYIAHDAEKRWGHILKKPGSYREQQELLRTQDWFDKQKETEEYKEFLRKKKEKENAINDG